MTQKTKQILKSYFETGDIPTQGNYVNLIDSLAVLQNDHNSGSLTLSGSLYISGSSYIDGNITASGNISASGDIIGSSLTVDGAIQYSATDTSEDALHYLTFKKPGNTLSNITNGFSFNPSTDRLALGGVIAIAGQAGTITGLNSLTSVHITASGNISASGTITANAFVGPITGTVTGTSTGLTGTPSILVANITSSGNISASGDITANAFYGDGSGLTNAPSTFTNITASGNISASGAIIGSTLAIDSITSTAAELNLLGGVSGLVQADFTKLAAINTSAAELNYLDGISSAQGGYVKAMNQSVVSTASPTFEGLTLTKKDYGDIDLDVAQSHDLGGDSAGQLLVGHIPSILAGASSATYNLTSENIIATSVIMISTSGDITCNATKIADGSCKITFHNPTLTDFSGGNVTINIVII
jgi:hypothetical protein